MAIIRWEPVGELNTIQNEMNRLFNTLFDSPARASQPNSGRQRWIPPMDLVETDGQYVLRADLPGLSEADVKIELTDNVLTVSGERRPEHQETTGGYYRVERAFGGFSRSLTLPEGVNPDAVQAHFDSGVLEIRIPKPEQRQPRKVEISFGGSASTPEPIDGPETPAATRSATQAPVGAGS